MIAGDMFQNVDCVFVELVKQLPKQRHYGFRRSYFPVLPDGDCFSAAIVYFSDSNLLRSVWHN